jgi:hypothetical protein
MATDRTKISFADAEGKIRFPGVLKWGELDQRLRATLWNAVLPFFEEQIGWDNIYRRSFYRSPLGEILQREFVERRHSFESDFINHYRSRESCLEDWASIFKQQDYVELFDFVTFFLRDPKTPKRLAAAVERALENPWSPYRLLLKPPAVVPAISEQEGRILKSDLDGVFESKFEGSKAHVQSALDALNESDNLSVIRESINAVESATRDFTGDSKAILSSALKKLASKENTHQALLSAFEKLYAYTSDEKGIRHSLVFGKNENVSFDEAIFFVSACSAFISYLDRKLPGKVSKPSRRANNPARS